MKTSKYKLLGMSLVALSILQATSAIAETGQEGHGGFKNYEVTKMIQESAKQLAATLSDSVIPMLKQHPERRGIVISALEHIKIKPLARRQRFGDQLILDYDKKTQTISILKDFFDIFTPNADEIDAIPKIKILLLHETAHLWDANDDEAESFANEVLGIHKDACSRFKKMSDQKVFEVVFSQGFGTCTIENNDGYYGVFSKGKQISPTYYGPYSNAQSFQPGSMSVATGFVEIMCEGLCDLHVK